MLMPSARSIITSSLAKCFSTLSHPIHDLDHADASYQTLSKKGLKILIAVLSASGIGFAIYFAIAVSPWVLAFAAFAPVCVIYNKRFIYNAFQFSGGLAVCTLGGYFIMAETIAISTIFMAIFVAIVGHVVIVIYKVDEWLTKETYVRVVNHLALLAISWAFLVTATILR